jgi:uncharacterized protein (DUF697 family)/tellurite resistance protein
MNKSEQEAVVAIALLAAFSDGQKDEAEHAAIRRVAEGFEIQLVDMASLYQQIITGKLTLNQAAGQLTSDQAKSLAYEVARCICEADGYMHPAEEAFLKDLTAILRPAASPVVNSSGATTSSATNASTSTSTSAQTASNELAVIGPIPTDPKDPLDPTLIKYSILTAALELLPQTAGMLAILPVQLKMVYDISKRHGIEMDYLAVKDFGAALGVGAAGQLLESGLRKLLSTMVGTVGGGVAGSMSSGVAGTAMTFATTYALGMVAEQYYAAGRKIDIATLKVEFARLIEKAKETQVQYSQEIVDKAKHLTDKLKNADIGSLLGGLAHGKF